MQPEIVAMLERVELLLDGNRAEQAVQLAARAIAAAPDEPWCHAVLARALQACGRHLDALTAAHQAIGLDPAAPGSYLTAQRSAIALDRYAEAIEFGRQAVRLMPDNAVAHAQLASSLAKSSAGQAAFGMPIARGLREARREATTAVRLESDNPSTHFASGYVAMATRRRGAARRSFRQALALDPLHTPSHHNLAVLDRQGGRLWRSGAGFVRALRIDPTQQRTQANVLITLYAQVIALHALAWAGYLAFMLHNTNLPLLTYQLAWTKRCDVALCVTAGVTLLGLLAYRGTDPAVRQLARSVATRRPAAWLVGCADIAMLCAFWVGTLGLGPTAENAYMLGLLGTLGAAVPLIVLVAEARRQQNTA